MEGSREDKMNGSNINQMHSCEICGLSHLSDDDMREHTRTCHIEGGNGQCPFCGLSAVPAELLLHVNQAHLDYLTPDNEMMMSFIDDRSMEGDSDSECRGLTSPEDRNDVPNGYHNANFVNNSSYQNRNTNHVQNNLNNINTTSKSLSEEAPVVQNGSSGATPKKRAEPQAQGNSSADSPVVNGSPLRSQLGLKLKNSHTPKRTAKSPLECLLCNYKTDSSSVLEEHINRTHFDPLSPSGNNNNHSNGDNQAVQQNSTLTAMQCPICMRAFASGSDLELHVNIEHKDILSPANFESPEAANGQNGQSPNQCPICSMSFDRMTVNEMEVHIETHFGKSPNKTEDKESHLEKEAVRLREEREFEMLRAQYGMDDQGNFREQSAAAMQRAVYAGEMSVADYYERQVGLRAAEGRGIDDGTSCTKSVTARILSLSANAPGITKSVICSGVDHYASNYGDKGWGCGYRNLQMLLSSLLQNTIYNEALYSAWGNHGPSRTAMPSISRLQVMVEAAWNQGFDVQGAEQLGSKLHNTRKWIGATEIVTVLSWLRIKCQLVDFHRPTSSDGRHPELFNWVLQYFEEPKVHTPPLYLQHQGHSRTIIGIEQRANGLTLLILDPSHGPRQVAALGSNQDSLRLIRRGPAAMRAPQYQIVAVKGIIETKEEYQASKVLRSLRIPPDR